jgi:hypothetical protein
MANKMKILVRLPRQEGLTYYRRAGLCLTRGADNVVEVDEAQLDALLKDPELAVGEPPPEKKSEKPPEKK